MVGRSVRTAIRVGGTAPLVLGALALDPASASTLACDTSDGAVRCSDSLLGDLAVAAQGDQVAIAYNNDGVSADARLSLIDTICKVCTVTPGPVKGHPQCLSGFDPVVDRWISETVDKVRSLAGGGDTSGPLS